ncbi:hypothetical protein [Bacillus sp. 165]|uniref:hypothetical protein n=1 Tax=Bacillus sp. 165 TaxID=1529117 RepID=UPI001ADC1B16|nr:hypothetical protein [Bacillus sp. 165]MBO9129855.1 hypothetical protein [Bacillus sp. 165]
MFNFGGHRCGDDEFVAGARDHGHGHVHGIVRGLAPGQEVAVWFDSSGFIRARFQTTQGNFTLFLIGGVVVRILTRDIRAIALL